MNDSYARKRLKNKSGKIVKQLRDLFWLFPKCCLIDSCQNWIRKLKLTQNNKNNFPIIFIIFGIQSIFRISWLRYEINMESKGEIDCELKINFPKKLTNDSTYPKLTKVI